MLYLFFLGIRANCSLFCHSNCRRLSNEASAATVCLARLGPVWFRPMCGGAGTQIAMNAQVLSSPRALLCPAQARPRSAFAPCPARAHKRTPSQCACVAQQGLACETTGQPSGEFAAPKHAKSLIHGNRHCRLSISDPPDLDNYLAGIGNCPLNTGGLHETTAMATTKAR